MHVVDLYIDKIGERCTHHRKLGPATTLSFNNNFLSSFCRRYAKHQHNRKYREISCGSCAAAHDTVLRIQIGGETTHVPLATTICRTPHDTSVSHFGTDSEWARWRFEHLAYSWKNAGRTAVEQAAVQALLNCRQNRRARGRKKQLKRSTLHR